MQATNTDCTIATVNLVPIIRATSASLPARICTDSPVKKTVAPFLRMLVERQKSDVCIVFVLVVVPVG